MLERIRNRLLRRTLRFLIALVVFVAGWFIVNRIMSPMNAVRVVEPPAAAEADPIAFAGRLRIAAWNIAHGRGTDESNWQLHKRQAQRDRLKTISQLLVDQRVDVVILNEVDFDSVWSGHVNQAETIAREAGLKWRVEGRHYDVAAPFVALRFGNAVLSRFPISEARRVALPGASKTEDLLAGRKDGLLCTLRLGDNTTVRVLAVHLDHRSESVRVGSASVISDQVDDTLPPLVAAGDFNSTLLGFPHATPDANGRTALSNLLDAGHWSTQPATGPAATDLTFPSTKPRSVIDWVLVPAGWTILSKTVIPTTLSDHLPVVMEVVMP